MLVGGAVSTRRKPPPFEFREDFSSIRSLPSRHGPMPTNWADPDDTGRPDLHGLADRVEEWLAIADRTDTPPAIRQQYRYRVAVALRDNAHAICTAISELGQYEEDLIRAQDEVRRLTEQILRERVLHTRTQEVADMKNISRPGNDPFCQP